MSAEQVSRWQGSLSSAIAAHSGLDDAERVDSIRSLEELVCTATAAQAALSADLDASQRAEQAASGMPAHAPHLGGLAGRTDHGVDRDADCPETACLELEDRRAVDEMVAGDPEKLEAMGTGEVVAACELVKFPV